MNKYIDMTGIYQGMPLMPTTWALAQDWMRRNKLPPTIWWSAIWLERWPCDGLEWGWKYYMPRNGAVVYPHMAKFFVHFFGTNSLDDLLVPISKCRHMDCPIQEMPPPF